MRLRQYSTKQKPIRNARHSTWCNGEVERKKVKTKLDWKGVGQFLSVVVKVVTIITTTMKEIGVGIGIMDWLHGPGKTEFISVLKQLGGSYKKSIPVELPPKRGAGQPYTIHRAEVDLSADPKLPFVGVVRDTPLQGNAKAIVELKSDDNLYVDGRKMLLHLENGQKDGATMTGVQLRDALNGKDVANVCLLDFLTEHQEFIPHHWKVDENGNTRYIFFWGTIYRRSDDRLYVRYLYWSGAGWRWDCLWLDHDWDSFRPAAVSAS